MFIVLICPYTCVSHTNKDYLLTYLHTHLPALLADQNTRDSQIHSLKLIITLHLHSLLEGQCHCLIMLLVISMWGQNTNGFYYLLLMLCRNWPRDSFTVKARTESGHYM